MACIHRALECWAQAPELCGNCHNEMSPYGAWIKSYDLVAEKPAFTIGAMAGFQSRQIMRWPVKLK